MLLELEKTFGYLDEMDLNIGSMTSEELETINDRIVTIIFNDNSIHIGDGNKISESVIADRFNG